MTNTKQMWSNNAFEVLFESTHVNIGNKPLPDPMLTMFLAISDHKTTMS